MRWTERSTVNVEKDVFLGFYIIRKLMEAHKLSVEVEFRPVQIPSSG